MTVRRPAAGAVRPDDQLLLLFVIDVIWLDSQFPCCSRLDRIDWIVDHWRRKGLSVVSLDDDVPVVSGDNPERQVEARQGLERFAKALGALPAAQREAFLLHEEAGMSVAEIAQATGAGEEAAKSRLRYALAKLKAAVDE